MTYMAEVRHHLADSRDRGLPFDRAWREAMEALPPWPNERSGYPPNVVKFARKMFEKAYYGHELPGPDMRGIVDALDDAREHDGLASGRAVA